MRDQLLPNEGPPEHERWQKPGASDSSGPGSPGSVTALSAQSESDPEGNELPSPNKLFAIARAADDLSKQSDMGKRRAAQTRSWRAFHNEHPDGSRYRHENYTNRSKLFVPKTHSSVIKNAVAFASALFSTNDVVSVASERGADPRSSASADVIKADLNIRLDRNSHKSGIPWFWIAMGACIEAQVAGVTFSKQYWEYEFLNDVFEVEPDPNRPEPVVVGMDGSPIQKITKKRVLRDRFVIEPHAAENVVIDMAAPFYDVVQGGAFLIVKIPMHVGDVRTMMKPGRQHMGGSAWFEVSEDVLAGAARDYTNTAVRSARDKGTDRYSTQNNARINDMQIVWVHENFVRYNGRDYQFWSLGTQRLLSEPLETIEAYPAHHGDRPYVMGIGAIEPHNALPMSPVECWRPLQDATNEITNLGIDTIRQGISPIKKVVRGKKVDLKQLRRMGPDATILVSDKDDVTFEVPPNNAEAAFAQLDRLAVMQDELSGNFSTSAVQSNRNLNETVGGMKMLAGSASGKTEYDLRIIIETWAEPVIRQCVWLIQYYETDARMLKMAGEKAKLFEKYQGASPEEMDLLESEVTVRVNLGIGAADPMQRLQKFIQGMKSIQELSASGAFAGQVQANAKAIYDELLGLCGYPEAERFFAFISPEEAAAKQPPGEGELKAKELDANIADKQAQTDLKKQELDQKGQEFAFNTRKAALEHHGQMQDREAAERSQEVDQRSQEQDMSLRREDQQHQQGMGRGDLALKALTAIGSHQQNQQQIDGQQDLDAQRMEMERQQPQPQGPQGSAAPDQAPPQIDIGQMMQLMQSLIEMQAQQKQEMDAILQQSQGQTKAIDLLLEHMQERDEKRRAVRTSLGKDVPVETTRRPSSRDAGLIAGA